MPSLKELLISFIGTEETDEPVAALTDPNGVTATMMALLWYLQKKPQKLAVEEELLKGLAHHHMHTGAIQASSAL
jgi:hypothetical protein